MSCVRLWLNTWLPVTASITEAVVAPSEYHASRPWNSTNRASALGAGTAGRVVLGARPDTGEPTTLSTRPPSATLTRTKLSKACRPSTVCANVTWVTPASER